MFGWMQKKFSESQRREAESFYVIIKGADQGVLDLVNGSCMYWAAFYDQRGHDLYEMESWIPRNDSFPVAIGSSIKGLQKQGTTSSVPGLMVWLHSARGLLWPELRFQARLLWQELIKASDEAVETALEMCSATNVEPLSFDHRRIPSGLEPIER